METQPDPNGLFDAYTEGQDGEEKKAFSKKKLSDIQKRIEKFEKDFEKFEEIDIDGEDARDRALEKMYPFSEGCNITIKDSEGSSWMWTDGWELIDSKKTASFKKNLTPILSDCMREHREFMNEYRLLDEKYIKGYSVPKELKPEYLEKKAVIFKAHLENLTKMVEAFKRMGSEESEMYMRMRKFLSAVKAKKPTGVTLEALMLQWQNQESWT